MTKRVKFQEMLVDLRRSLEKGPEHRTGRNTRYEIVNAGLGAFLGTGDHYTPGRAQQAGL